MLQPLDVCLNKPFKSLLRHSWQNYMFKKNKLDPKEKIPPPSRQDIIDWVEDAWSKSKAKRAAIIKSFLVTGISNTFGTWEDNLIRSDNLLEAIDTQLLEVFGEVQLSSKQPPPADDIFDDVSSDSSTDDSSDESDEEICHNDIIFTRESSESESEWSIDAGEWSPISNCSDNVA